MISRINPQNYKALQISLASPEKILSWSSGEIKTAETINYRTLKPERDGLFCGKIFGPVRDFECVCGKYKRMKHRGIKCDKCGVEVIESKVRRERLGHIKLACPVSHVWFLKGLPSRLANILDISLKDMDRVLYFDAYLVLSPGDNTLVAKHAVIDENQYRELAAEYAGFKAEMGAGAVKEAIEEIKLEEEADELRAELADTNSETKRKKIIKRLKIIESFMSSGVDPSNMIPTVIPVLPPDLRPLVALEGGRFATSDLNDLYRRVIHRNNRLKRLIELNAPEIIVKNEKRMLQESVDALFDNGRRGKAILGPNKRALKSLSDSLKGKYGRFRQNLLGKRVDYSGRSVIVVGPELKLNQCGLPKYMALELFKPFILRDLMKNEKVPSIKLAKKKLEDQDPEVWSALDRVIIEHPVLLNRAPTLHRLGIQAFEPKLIEGKAIQLHPLVCTAFNADFDGDQMAIHVPLSLEAQLEAKVLMMAVNNIFSPATGKPVMMPSQDMVLGIYWLSKEMQNQIGEGRVFGSVSKVIKAFEQEGLSLNARIAVFINGEKKQTTAGRVLLYDILPEGKIPFDSVNKLFKKKDIESFIDECYRNTGNKETVRILDAIKNLGYKHSTIAGFSISMSDMIIPAEKAEIISKAEEEVQAIHEQHQDGIITDGERYNKVVDTWSRVTEDIANHMIRTLGEERFDEEGRTQLNPIFVMADSGARGSTNQSKQLGGMRGLMAKPTGEIIETPITANFREGLSVHQYFISTHGARKGLADTALKTARSGYLTRRLVDVAQDVVVSEEDCGTLRGLEVTALLENGEVIAKLSERVLGRITADDVHDPQNPDEVLIPADTMLAEAEVALIESKGVEVVLVRSVLTCESQVGGELCSRCYGRDLGRGILVSVGEAVGVVAAQSIGEPGTQLTMRTFHIGGTANKTIERSFWDSAKSGRLSLSGVNMVRNKEGTQVVMDRNSEAVIYDAHDREVERFRLPIGSRLNNSDGESVSVGQKIAEWDPFSIPILTDVSGVVNYVDIHEGRSMKVQTDEATGASREVITESLDGDLKPRIVITDAENNSVVQRPDGRDHRGFYLSSKTELMVKEGDLISSGDVIAKIMRATAKNKDITGGLPRIVDLFEARVPKDPCQISDITGRIEFGDDVRKKRRIIVVPDQGEPKEYLIPKNKHVIVFEDEIVNSGDRLTEGAINPHDLLRVSGIAAVQKFLVDEVQAVYRLQGVQINDKHVEVIIRQMLSKVQITSPGDSTLLIGQTIDKKRFLSINLTLQEDGREQVEAEPLLLGITKAALGTDSFVSAASFQETTKILTDSAVLGRYDHLKGLKENVIMGRLIPAGTGFHRDKSYNYHIDEIEESAIESRIEDFRAMEEEDIFLNEEFSDNE